MHPLSVKSSVTVHRLCRRRATAAVLLAAIVVLVKHYENVNDQLFRSRAPFQYVLPEQQKRKLRHAGMGDSIPNDRCTPVKHVWITERGRERQIALLRAFLCLSPIRYHSNRRVSDLGVKVNKYRVFRLFPAFLELLERRWSTASFPAR